MAEKKKTEIIGRAFSAWLSRKSEIVPKGAKRLLLLLVFVSVSSYCLVLIIGNGQTILFPQNISLPGVSHMDSKAVISQRIHMLNTYLDSLQSTSSGQKEYDSLMKVHPYIYDSIASWKEQLEKLP